MEWTSSLLQVKRARSTCFSNRDLFGLQVLTFAFLQARVEDTRTTIYQRDHAITYQLKLKNSRAVFSEIQKKAGAFPFNIRILEDEKRARLGLQEAVQHSLVKPYEVV
jgi:hypothetical protein